MSPAARLRTQYPAWGTIFFRISPFWWAHFERTVLSAHWAVCAHIWRGFMACLGHSIFLIILGLFLRGFLRSRLGSAGNFAPPYPLHTITTLPRDVGAQANYMFLESTYQELFKKYNFVGPVTPLGKVTEVSSWWNFEFFRSQFSDIRFWQNMVDCTPL